MAEPVIVCPHCKKEIPLTEAIAHPIRENLRQQFEAAAQKDHAELARKEEALRRREEELAGASKTLEDQVALKVKAALGKQAEEAKKKAAEDAALEMSDLRAQLDEQSKKARDAGKFELEARKKLREAEEKEKNFELEKQRALDAERQKIREDALKTAGEEHHLKDQEKEKQIGDLRKQVDEMKRKLEQGSQQTQGEVLELELEAALRANFPHDRIEPVPKGVKGADVLQRVIAPSGQNCGTIIWESKRTKAWSEGWIAKLKADQLEAKADIAALLTAVLPKDIGNMGCQDGVWIANNACAMGMAAVLRHGLLQVAQERRSAEGQEEKKNLLYTYLCSGEFSRRVEAIAKNFNQMRQALDDERRAMTKSWAKREKQIEQTNMYLATMYGTIDGVIGGSLPQIPSFELKQLALDGESS